MRITSNKLNPQTRMNRIQWELMSTPLTDHEWNKGRYRQLRVAFMKARQQQQLIDMRKANRK